MKKLYGKIMNEFKLRWINLINEEEISWERNFMYRVLIYSHFWKINFRMTQTNIKVDI